MWRLFVVFLVVVKIMATEMLLVCGEDSNRFGQPEHSILENVASF